MDVTAAQVDARIEQEVLPELRRHSTILTSLDEKLGTFNGPVMAAVVRLSEVSDKLIELATERSHKDALDAARALIAAEEMEKRRRSQRWRWWKRGAVVAIVLTPWVALVASLVGLLPALLRLFH